MATEDISRLKIDKQALTKRPAWRRRRIFLILPLVVVVLAIILWKTVLAPVVQIETATVTQAYPSQAFTLLNASGYVVAQRKAALASKATGRLDWLGVEEGSRVKSGDVIARLEGRDVDASLRQAAAALTSAKAQKEQAAVENADAARNLNRQKELLAQGVISQADFDVAEARRERGIAALSAAQANVKVAEGALEGADVALDYTRIRAPFDGVVLTKNADVGDIVTPLGAAANAKASVVTIADLASLRVEADVSESNLEQVKAGQPCEILLDALPGSRFRGVVHAIVPTADRSKATVLVKVSFVDRDPRILPEMSAKVAFLEHPLAAGEQKPRTVVPPAALVSRNGSHYVYLLKGERVVETRVTLGGKVGDMQEVTAGVKAGDRIAMKPLEKLKDGSRVKSGDK
ncbi:MAG TPA: efflux RND transporter periplasmic adaptor subunit [Geobacteraceae bacterium]|nr:efflux RND transporter periplasmic adaptor subunit [Geobacteraceae bacterium]